MILYRNIGLILTLLVLNSAIFGQTYRKTQFRVNEGMPTDLSKSVVKDKLGFIWIATDEGLVRYDGREFIQYTSELPTTYIKEVFLSSSNRLYAVTDFSITEILNSTDTVIFREVLHGGRYMTDTTVFYPKSMYEDRLGNFWISEPASVVRLNKDVMKRYTMPVKNTSDSFKRTFSFTEDTYGRLWMISFPGFLYFYDISTDQFVEVPTDLNLRETNAILSHEDGELWVGCLDGLYQLKVNWEGKLISKSKADSEIRNVSKIARIEDKLLLGTFESEFYLMEPDLMDYEHFENLYKVNDIQADSPDEVWLATDVGLILLEKKYFVTHPEIRDLNFYIESICHTNDSTLYFCYKDGLHRLDKRTGRLKQRVLVKDYNQYFLSLVYSNDKLYASSSSKLLVFQNDRLINEFDFTPYGRFIFSINSDTTGNIWLSQDGAAGMVRIDPEDNISFYGEEQGLNARIICSGISGNKLLAGGSDESSYLFEYDLSSDRFSNKSVPLGFDYDVELEVNELEILNDATWLATTVGLLRYENGKIERIDLNEMTDKAVKAIAVGDQNTLWLANSDGIIKYFMDSGEFVLFDISSGLPSNSANKRALSLDSNNRLWVGTANGLVYSESNSFQSKVTPRPRLLSLLINEDKTNMDDAILEELPFNSYLQASVISLCFPGDKIQYQYKVNETGWVDMKSNQVVVPSLKNGEYNLSVRARQRGNYMWSESLNLDFNVSNAWYRTVYAFIFYGLILMILILLVIRFTNARLKILETRLNSIVDARTKELLDANNELNQINRELDMFVYSTSHDLRAPLASILGLINIYEKEEDEEQKKGIMSMMRISVIKLDNFIKDIINYSKNTRLDITRDKIDFELLSREIFQSLKYIEGAEDMEFEVKVEEEENFYSDEKRLNVLLNNLIANSIHYRSLNGRSPYIKLTISTNKKYASIEVKDNGQGIDKNHLERIFDMFYRASETAVGSGLGLYIVKETISRLDGKIEVESETGVGTIFKIQIPNLIDQKGDLMNRR